MELYLAQHGEAKSKDEDPRRPLTENGLSDVSAVAVALKRHALHPEAVWHSGKLRAKQTAAAFADALEPLEGVHEKQGLAPNDDPAGMAETLAGLEKPVLVVGHLPHLDRLVSRLVTGQPEGEIVRFQPGGALCLARVEQGWRIAWHLTPDLARVVTA